MFCNCFTGLFFHTAFGNGRGTGGRLSNRSEIKMTIHYAHSAPAIKSRMLRSWENVSVKKMDTIWTPGPKCAKWQHA
jgi:hypothetical protein